MLRNERFIDHKDVRLWTESFGSKENPCLFLIMGAACQAIFWPDSFCESLANHFYVIRFDNRDVGKSTSCDFHKAPYDLNVMTEDAHAILLAYGIEKAHIVGASMGGMIGMRLALKYPQEVLSLTLLMSTACHKPLTNALAGRPSSSSLPPPTDAFMRFFSHFRPSTSEEEYLQGGVMLLAVLNGSLLPFDPQEALSLQQRAYKRNSSQSTFLNHFFACDLTEECDDKLSSLTAPVLIIHGEQDPLIPFAHALAMKEKITGVEFIDIPKMGHYLSHSLSQHIKGLLLHFLLPHRPLVLAPHEEAEAGFFLKENAS